MSLSEEVRLNRYKILWDSLRMGCEKVLEKNPQDSGAKFTLQYMALMESIVSVGEGVIKSFEENKGSTDAGIEQKKE